MKIEQVTVGARVKTLVDFFGLPCGSEGVIVEDYDTGVTVRWQLKLGRTPLEDGFDKKTELQYLELLSPSDGP